MTKKSYVQIPLKDRIETYRLRKNSSEKIVKPTKKQKLYKQKIDLMSFREDFREELDQFRQKHDIPVSGFTDFEDCISWSKKQNREEYDLELNRLLGKFAIAIRWREAIEYFILFNSSEAWLVLPSSVGLKMMQDSETGGMGLFLQIYKDTKVEDIKLSWSSIQMMKGLIKPYDEDAPQNMPRFLTRSRKISNKKDRKLESGSLKLQKKIYELHLEGKSSREIGRIVNRSYDTVNIYLHRFKKELESVRLD